MAARITICAVLLAVMALGVRAQNSCNDITPGAKYRYFYSYKLKDNNDAGRKGIAAAVDKRFKEDCPMALKYGQGPAVSVTPAQFGLSANAAGNAFADYAVWSDWKSLEDLQKCQDNGAKSGNREALRKWTTKAWRLVMDTSNIKGSTAHTCAAGSPAPATIRYIFTYRMPNANADMCSKASSLQDKITAQSVVVRSGSGCHVVSDEAKMFGAGIKRRVDFGGFVDFKNTDDLAKYFASTDENVKKARAESRGMSTRSMRIVMPLASAAPAVAKESGTGRRMQM